MNRLRWLFFLAGFLLVLTSGPASADVIVDGSDAQADLGPPVDCNGASAAPSSVSEGLRSTTSGETLWVCPHTYDETLVVDTPNITIRSGPPSGDSTNTVVRAPNSASSSLIPAVAIAADDVRVLGMRFRNGWEGIRFSGVSGGLVRSARSDSNTADGVFVTSSSNLRFDGSLFDNNDLNGANVSTSDSSVFFNNRVRGNANVGIRLFDASGNRLEGNRTTLNAIDGVALRGVSTGNHLEGNRTRDNGFDGVFAADNANSNTFQDNRAVFNGRHGFALNGVDSNAVRGNVLDTNVFSGLAIGGGGDHLVRSNRLRFNGGHGANVVSSGGNELRGNILHSNGVDNVRLNGATNNTLSSNVLRDAAGTDDNGVVLEAGSDGNALGGNRLEEHDSAGVKVVNSNNNTLRDNRIDTNTLGVWLHNADDHLVDGNRIRDNDTGIFVTGSPADSAISNAAPDNNIVGNGQGVVNTTVRIFDARKSWWGDASGPSGGNTDPFTGRTATGTGDEIAAPGAPDTNVAFDPFLATATFEGGGGAGTAEECIVQRVGGAGPLTERLRTFRDRHLEGRLGRWLTRQYYRVSSVVVSGDSG